MSTVHRVKDTLAGNAGPANRHGGLERKGQSGLTINAYPRQFLSRGGSSALGSKIPKLLPNLVLAYSSFEHCDEASLRLKGWFSECTDVHFVKCDLGNLATLKQVADKIGREEGQLDIVC